MLTNALMLIRQNTDFDLIGAQLVIFVFLFLTHSNRKSFLYIKKRSHRNGIKRKRTCKVRWAELPWVRTRSTTPSGPKIMLPDMHCQWHTQLCLVIWVNAIKVPLDIVSLQTATAANKCGLTHIWAEFQTPIAPLDPTPSFTLWLMPAPPALSRRRSPLQIWQQIFGTDGLSIQHHLLRFFQLRRCQQRTQTHLAVLSNRGRFFSPHTIWLANWWSRWELQIPSYHSRWRPVGLNWNRDPAVVLYCLLSTVLLLLALMVHWAGGTDYEMFSFWHNLYKKKEIETLLLDTHVSCFHKSNTACFSWWCTHGSRPPTKSHFITGANFNQCPTSLAPTQHVPGTSWNLCRPAHDSCCHSQIRVSGRNRTSCFVDEGPLWWIRHAPPHRDGLWIARVHSSQFFTGTPVPRCNKRCLFIFGFTRSFFWSLPVCFFFQLTILPLELISLFLGLEDQDWEDLSYFI